MQNIEGRCGRQALGEYLLLLRKVNNLFQREVTELSGIPRSKISAYERGVQIPSLNNLERLLEVYGVSEYDYGERNKAKKLWGNAYLEITRIRKS